MFFFLHNTDDAAWWGEGGLEKLSFAKLEGGRNFYG